MLRWALLFLVIALIAGVLGFWGLEGTAMWIAKVLFVVFLICFIVSLVQGRRGPVVLILCHSSIEDVVGRASQPVRLLDGLGSPSYHRLVRRAN